ncbi:MAG: TetR/AcrR family transcriptional regulator [Desulfobacteraceae bacterium]|nr:TetR/AcrR family transcriptional regulator [Desulfobacteraceae bacterium]
MASISRKERDDQRRRQEILDTALSIFAAKGFHGTTMAQISQESQYPLGTIYKYFSGKQQMYHDLVLHKVQELGLIFLDISKKKEATARQKLLDSLFAKARFYRNNDEVIRIYISERSNIDAVLMPKLNQKVNKMHQKMVDLFQAIFEQGIRDGEFKAYPAKEIAIVFSDIAHSASWASLFREEDEAALDQRLTMIFEMFTKGVSIN